VYTSPLGQLDAGNLGVGCVNPFLLGFFVGLKSYTGVSMSVVADEDDGSVIGNRRLSSILPEFTF
jgi:hypothetical protein